MVDRAKAIRTLFYNAKKVGMSKDDLETAILISNGRTGRISMLSAKELKKALKDVFDINLAVEEDKMAYKIAIYCRQHGITWKSVETLIKDHFGKKKKIESIYHLTHAQKWKLLEVIKEMTEKNKNEE